MGWRTLIAGSEYLVEGCSRFLSRSSTRRWGRPKVAAVLFLIYVIYIVPVIVGIWNAAGKYKGRKIWAITARVVAVIGAFKIVSVLLALPRAFG